MRDVLDDMLRWWRSRQPFAMGTVVATYHSAPRPAGASMLLGPEGQAVGSVSGGCVEGAVYELGESVLRTGRPVLQRYGSSDDQAFDVGLTCGGVMDVFVEQVDQVSFPELESVADDLRQGRPVAVATVVEHPSVGLVGRRMVIRPEAATGTFSDPGLDAAVTADATELLVRGEHRTLTYGRGGDRERDGIRVFVWAFAPAPRLLVLGAIDFAAALTHVGAFLGYRVTVVDARPVFATAARFPHAHEVIAAWPHRYLRQEVDAGRIDSRTSICVLTHDPKFDVPLLELALTLPDLGYIGAMGSRRTHHDRDARLLEAGLSAEQLARLSSPIGLDLGGRTPEETAISIAAEMIALRSGASGLRLSDKDGPIHSVPAESLLFSV